MREYELWLDESGDFLSESQNTSGKNPSMIGGILMPKGALKDAQIRALADPENTGAFHAMDMSYAEAQKIVPAALEGLCNAGAKLVYFENSERIYYHSNRDLYLRVLASGLAQLVKLLSVSGAFTLNIIIAIRYAPDEENTESIQQIPPEEYRVELKRYITREFEDINYTLSPDCHIALTVLSARQEARLALADYASNARFVLNSKKFQPVKSRLLPLIEAGYRFSITALTTEASIRSKLSTYDISGALIDYYTSRGRMHKKQMFQEIMERFSTLSYRLQRLQIRSFASSLRIFVAKETDFERSEALLKTVIKDLFGKLKAEYPQVQTDESLFTLELALADMYLREGDVINAAPIMESMETLINSMNYRVENLAYLYLYREKKALYEINRMEYEKSAHTSSQTIQTIENLISVLNADDLTLSFFSRENPMASEYLGDTYCMKVYAELFIQRTDNNIFENSLRTDTEKALSQYHYSGELERNQQYRSKAENEAGNCHSAIEWLLKTKNISLSSKDLELCCIQYLNAARNEDALSRAYYVMYYLEIMENASRLGQTNICDPMKTALCKEQATLQDILLEEKDTEIISDAQRKHQIFTDIFADEKKRNYHPTEISLWKYGVCLWREGSRKAAEKCWERAIRICDENPDYTVLKIVALAILLEWISLLPINDKTNETLKQRLIARCTSLLSIPNLPETMCSYAEKVQCYAKKPNEYQEEGYMLSRIIAY